VRLKLRYTFRCYPTPPQERALAQTFGCVRVAYNSALRLRTDSFKEGRTINYNASSAALTALKKTPEKAFLNEVSSVPLQQSLRHLQTAFVNFFEKRAKYPAFKRRHGRQSADYTTSAFKWDARNKNLAIAKLGRLDVHWSKEFTSTPSTVTITKDRAGRYFVTLCLDESIEALPKTGREVGIDLGINRLATLSTGERLSNPRHTVKREKKLAGLQRILARRKKGSGRWERQRLKVARCHAGIADARKDHLDKVTTDLVRRFDVLAIENLNVRGMVTNHCLARAISDASFGTFRRMIEYKAAWYGKEVRVADRFFPSSKRCSACGHVHAKMPLDVRQFSCEACGASHDRDENAAKNILKFAGGQPVKARGEKVRLKRVSTRSSTSRRNVNQPAL
jgi:putative transposase